MMIHVSLVIYSLFEGGDNDIDRLFEWEVQRFICNEVIQHLVKSGDVKVHGCYQLLSHATGSVIRNARDRKQMPRTAEHISQYLKTNRTSIFETLEVILFLTIFVYIICLYSSSYPLGFSNDCRRFSLTEPLPLE